MVYAHGSEHRHKVELHPLIKRLEGKRVEERPPEKGPRPTNYTSNMFIFTGSPGILKKKKFSTNNQLLLMWCS